MLMTGRHPPPAWPANPRRNWRFSQLCLISFGPRFYLPRDEAGSLDEMLRPAGRSDQIPELVRATRWPNDFAPAEKPWRARRATADAFALPKPPPRTAKAAPPPWVRAALAKRSAPSSPRPSTGAFPARTAESTGEGLRLSLSPSRPGAP